MNYEQFKTYVKESMEAVTGERVEIYPVVKNNSVIYDGLSVQPEGECMAVPTIYLGKYYEAYQNGTPAPLLVRDMMTFYETKKCRVGIDLDRFRDFSWLKDKVGFKLINRERNADLLQRLPHKSYLDLEMVYYLLFLGGETGDATMLIENNHLNIWGITPEDIHEAAMCNMPQLLPPTFRPMDMVMQDIYKEEIEAELRRHAEEASMGIGTSELEQAALDLMQAVRERQHTMPMYVISNERNFFGAGAILYCGKLAEWAEEVQCDLFVIPSSIHEVLVMPSVGFYSADTISEMIREINRTQVPPEEVLSDHVYIYHRNMGKITM